VEFTEEAGSDAMLAHIFKCSESSLYCVTSDPSGACLPEQSRAGQWRHIRDVELEDGDQRIAIDSAQAISEIRERGYHLLAGWYQRL
jgi:hypothetical protein